jgi:pyruvate/2-oxoglutarate dehydrogenase complex dihydrolipoamide acyltransferase (E2) component
LHGLISLQKKIDGQSLANLDDVPWYGVGPSEPTPIPILGPDIIDPRQMDLIRQQAQLAAAGRPYGIRELAPRVETPKVPAKAKSAAPAAASATVDDPAKAERERKRAEALARKHGAEAPVAQAAPATNGDSGGKKKFDKQAMLDKIRERKANKG